MTLLVPASLNVRIVHDHLLHDPVVLPLDKVMVDHPREFAAIEVFQTLPKNG